MSIAPHAASGEAMQVLLVSDASAYGGAESYQAELARAAAQSGLAIGSVVPNLPALDAWAERMASAGAAVLRVGGEPDLLRTVRQVRPTVLHANSSYRSDWRAVYRAAVAAGGSVVLTEQSVPPAPPAARGLRRLAPWRLRLARRWSRRRAEWRLATRVIAVSSAVRARLLERGLPADKTTVINHGVDTRRTAPDPQRRTATREALGLNGRFVVGSVGRLAGEKRYDRLLDLCAGAHAPEMSLLLVGDGEARGALERQAAELGLRDRVLFAGWQERVSDYLSAMDVFALSSDYEAMPFSLLEAMSAGLPVVATDVGGIGDVVRPEETGFLVSPGDAAALAAAVGTLRASADLRRRLGEGGRRLVVCEYSLEQMVRRTLALYGELLGGEAGPGEPAAAPREGAGA